MNEGSLHQFAKPRSTPKNHPNVVALAVILFAGLNLNHLLNHLTGIQHLLWPLVFCLVLLLCFRYAKYDFIGGAYVLFVAFLVSYLISSVLMTLAKQDIEWQFLTSYSVALVFTSGLYFWFAGQNRYDFITNLKFFKIVLLLSCIATVLSFYLGPNFGLSYLRADFGYGFYEDRASGLFEDPNETALVALFCLVLVVGIPSRRAFLTASQALVAILALLLTFSKAGFIIFLVLTCLTVRKWTHAIGFLTIVLIAVTWGPAYVGNNFEISEEHADRLTAVSKIVSSGEVTADTTTGRTLLWQFALEKIKKRFPWGAGLGEFHHMEGSYRDTKGVKDWLGAHNEFLMVLGEGGLLPFLLLVTFVVWLIATVYRATGGLASERMIAIAFVVILTGGMLSTHSLLGSQVSLISLAVTMAIAAKTPKNNALRSAHLNQADYKPKTTTG